MFLSFIESIKYVGHLLPISFLRIFVGLVYFQDALRQYRGDFLLRPRLADQIVEFLPGGQAPLWFKVLINAQFIPHWQTYSLVIWSVTLMVGVSYIIGYVVRPTALIAVLLSFLMLFISGPQQEEFYKTMIAIHFVLAWVGAGRCLGADYYFFKRRRGIWW